ncbi:Uncharacterized protein TCM_008175 [Theobroma cacao]|uniref:Uncharacterized protein n=1 Tax=Theobroma cacao TaxID=3641 RepID=A0A061EB19_THECC|nr:Uncharacterized protein TCM_008175 [Theobroma cacao]
MQMQMHVMQLEIQQSMQLEIQRAMQMQTQSLHEHIQHSLQGLEDQIVDRLIDCFEGRSSPLSSLIEHHIMLIPSPVEVAHHSQPTHSPKAPPHLFEVEERPHPMSSQTITFAHPALVPTLAEAPRHCEITPSAEAPPRPELEDARVILASKYLRSLYVNPLLVQRKAKDDLKDRYESFLKNDQARVNILGIER